MRVFGVKIVGVNKMLHLPGSCFEVDWLIRPSFREGFDLQDMFAPYIFGVKIG
jgi:hypothetical protein